jgi:AGZA family xanthine/uracil permease-like MFS transporter
MGRRVGGGHRGVDQTSGRGNAMIGSVTPDATLTAPSLTRLRPWVPGDWNGFFGLFTNVLLNVIVLSGLSLGVVKLPPAIVYGRILPALGIALPVGNLFYAWMAWRLARRAGRDDVTALPYGPSVPHMFIVVFLIMLPVYLKTNDPILAWRFGLAWAFIIGIIVLLGAFVGPTIRKYTPRAAMLGTLAGISIAFISMRPAFQMWEVAWLGLLSFGIVLVSWTANIRLPFGLPGGLVAVVVGTVVAWATTLLGWSDVMHPAQVGAALGQFGLHLPVPTGDVFKGLRDIGPLLVTAIPLGIYNFTEGMNNVESAAAAGDNYDLRQVLLADGSGATIGSILGSPFPPAVYIGHPGWKAVGGRIGYSLATGIVIAVVCFLGLTAMLLAVVPLVAILPILLYIGLVIGSQAFQTTPAKHAPAVVLALLPNIASWAQSQIDGALGAAGTSASKVGMDKLMDNGVVYHGMALLGGGAVLAGLILGAIAVFIIDRRFDRAAIYAFAGAVLSYFGFIHGTSLGVGASTQVAVGYLCLAAICIAIGWRQRAPRSI